MVGWLVGHTGGGVESGTARAESEGGAAVGAVTDNLAEDAGGLGPLAELRSVEGLLVTERREDVLAVRVPVNVQLDTGTVTQLTGKSVKASVLGAVGRLDTLVGLGAGVGGGTERVGVPAELPVTVDVAADTGGAAGAGLAVLAPQTVGNLAVDETWESVSRRIE